MRRVFRDAAEMPPLPVLQHKDHMTSCKVGEDTPQPDTSFECQCCYGLLFCTSLTSSSKLENFLSQLISTVASREGRANKGTAGDQQRAKEGSSWSA